MRISYFDCDSTYVRQTKRKLKTRIDEHQSDIKRNSTLSVISDHIVNYNHSIIVIRTLTLIEENVIVNNLI